MSQIKYVKVSYNSPKVGYKSPNLYTYGTVFEHQQGDLVVVPSVTNRMGYEIVTVSGMTYTPPSQPLKFILGKVDMASMLELKETAHRHHKDEEIQKAQEMFERAAIRLAEVKKKHGVW